MDARTQPAAVHIVSPFGEKTRKFSPEPGANLAAIIDGAAQELSWARGQVRVYWCGEEIPPAMWGETVPAPGDQVLIVPTPQYAYVYSAVQYVRSYLSTASIGGLVSTAARIATVASVGAKLVSSLFGGGSSRATYGISGAENSAMPDQVCPMVLGKRRVVPPLAATTWTETIGDDVYLRMLVQWHVDRCRVSDIRIGETPIEQFDGVEIQHRLTPEDPFPTLYNRIIREDTYGSLQLIHDNGWVERRTQVDTIEISIDLAWPTGLAWNGKDEARCDVQFQYRPANTSNWIAAPIGDGGLVKILEMKPQAFRRNYSWVVPKGEYDVRVLRVWPDAHDSYPRLQDQVFWVCMRSFGEGLPVIGDNFALTAVRIKSSNQLNGQISSLNGIVEAMVPKWDGQKFSGYGVSSNPGEQMNWMANGPANAKPLNDRFDVPGIGAFADLCFAKNWKCDYILDNEMSLANGLDLAASAGRALGVCWEDGLLSVSIDNEREAPVQVFSGRNVKNFRGKISFPEALHGVKVYFFDAASGYQQHCRIVYDDGYDATNATLFERIDAPVKTDAAEAYVQGWRYLAARKLRPEAYEFDTDLEGLVVHFGSRVDIAHTRMAVGIRGARVRSLTMRDDGAITGVVLDEIVPMEAGKSYVLRAQRGSGVGLFSVVTVPGETNTLSFMDAVPAANAPVPGNHCVFGLAGKETLPTLVIDPAIGESKSSHLTCIPYVEGLLVDGGEIPAWDPKITPRAMANPIATSHASEETRRQVADIIIPQLVNRTAANESATEAAQGAADTAMTQAQQAAEDLGKSVRDLIDTVLAQSQATALGVLGAAVDAKATRNAISTATKAALSEANALVADETVVRTQATEALAGRIQTVEANYVTSVQLGNAIVPLATKALVTDEASARAQGDNALGMRVQSIEADYTNSSTLAQALGSYLTVAQATGTFATIASINNLTARFGDNSSSATFQAGSTATSAGAVATGSFSVGASDGTHTVRAGWRVDAIVSNGTTSSVLTAYADKIRLKANATTFVANDNTEFATFDGATKQLIMACMPGITTTTFYSASQTGISTLSTNPSDDLTKLGDLGNDTTIVFGTAAGGASGYPISTASKKIFVTFNFTYKCHTSTQVTLRGGLWVQGNSGWFTLKDAESRASTGSNAIFQTLRVSCPVAPGQNYTAVRPFVHNTTGDVVELYNYSTQIEQQAK